MGETTKRIIKSTQEQAIASWITHLNQIRLDELIEKLNQQDINLEEALKELDEIKKFIGDPSHILGNVKTKHGEIAEHFQVGIANARRLIQGLEKNHTFEGVGRTAPEDYIRAGKQIQSKFYNGLNKTLFSGHGLQKHLEMYPDFVKSGGAYDIPKDQYEKMMELLEAYKNDPLKLKKVSISDYNLAKKIDDFLKDNGLELGKDINPSLVDYKDVQQGVANQTIDNEEKNIKKEDEKQREKAYRESKPSIKEGAKAAGVSAVIEGGVTFCMSVSKKRKEKKFNEFTSEDWKEIGIDTGKGIGQGGIRGGSIYILSNFTATPANVANAYVTAAFGVASQIKALENGKISEEEFIINCETMCLDVTVSTIASVVGQLVIPIPILGGVIGNITGEFVYELCKKQGTLKTQKIIEHYNMEMEQLNQKLDLKFLKVVLEIQNALKKFENLEKLAFDENINKAFGGSINLAIEIGVLETKILNTKEKIDNFFLM